MCPIRTTYKNLYVRDVEGRAPSRPHRTGQSPSLPKAIRRESGAGGLWILAANRVASFVFWRDVAVFGALHPDDRFLALEVVPEYREA